ncbi:hypothetical protein [Streptomyces apocyni]|uniref:hypothetical protein n=1 Tax=Streptomyces apocyni TaxID=2654677 RepID=UPI001E40E31F|nr:hypothetical protein [Streptomyces apocyni]
MSKVSRLTRVAAVLALAALASGCVTVHGERAIVPTATEEEAAQALEDFTTAYNKADKAYDPALSAGRVTGPLGAINQAGLRAKQKNNPDGNPGHSPLELTDAKFAIPQQAGWPRWFVADTKSNRGERTRWFLIFTRGGPDQLWQASYLTILGTDRVPEFTTDDDGWAEPVAPDSTEFAAAPESLSRRYTTYLKDGGDGFAPGKNTTVWRAAREKNSSRPGMSTQWVDQPLSDEGFAPRGLRTKDGGAVVFFASRHYEKRTAAQGVRLSVPPDLKALMTGEAKRSVTTEYTSNQIVRVPAKTADTTEVTVLNRIQGTTGAKGE